MVLVSLLSGCGYNQMQANEEAVFAAWGDVESSYQRRADLIPNLVEVVKGYATHEADTLKAVTEARAKVGSIQLNKDVLSNPQMLQQFQQNQGELSGALSRLMVVVEKYPDLKANQGFLDLQNQLEGTENRINVARVRYNKSVQEFNTSIRTFPNSLTNSLMLHLQRKESFKADEGAKTAPKVNFGGPSKWQIKNWAQELAIAPEYAQEAPMKKQIFLLIWALLLAFTSRGYALNVPEWKGYVNDYAGMLSTEQISKIEHDLELYDKVTSTQIFILTIPSLENEVIEQYSIKVVESEKWKAWRKGKDNGILILLAKNEHKIRIEVGRGLEGTVTDLISGRIIKNEMSPKLKSGNAADALEACVASIKAVIKGEYKNEDGKTAKGASDLEKIKWGGSLAVFLIIAGICAAIYRPLGGVAGAVLAPALGFFVFSVTIQVIIILVLIGFVAGLFADQLFMIGLQITLGGGGGSFGGGGASGDW